MRNGQNKAIESEHANALVDDDLFSAHRFPLLWGREYIYRWNPCPEEKSPPKGYGNKRRQRPLRVVETDHILVANLVAQIARPDRILSETPQLR